MPGPLSAGIRRTPVPPRRIKSAVERRDRGSGVGRRELQRPERSLHADLRGRHSLRVAVRRHVVLWIEKRRNPLVLPRTPHLPHEWCGRTTEGRGLRRGRRQRRDLHCVPGLLPYALDAKTGKPLEGFGQPVPVEGFPEAGVVDMLADSATDSVLLPWPSKGYITSSSPPIVVGDVVVVGTRQAGLQPVPN